MRQLTRKQVYEIIDTERFYQDGQSGLHDEDLSVADWVVFIENKLIKAKEEVYRLNNIGALEEIRKATALGVACMEYRGAPKRLLD